MRKKQAPKREYAADVMYDNIVVTRFINYVMKDGAKGAATKVVYAAMERAGKQLKKDPIEVFEKVIENVSPVVEVVSKRVGGANYQMPREVRPERRFVLASRWLLIAARSKSGKAMSERLADEFVAAYNNEGAAIKKKQDVHRMAEANRAFAHFAR
ncbi:MAG: 30S ribosomal protein S7 [bacterium]